MTRRLVEIDPQTFYAKEVDVKRLRREAQELRDYLLRLKSEDDAENLRKRVMPYCEKALSGTLELPVSVREEPIDITRILDLGGSVPDGFEELYARLFNTATGARAEVANPVHKDGKVWAWMEFED